MNRFFKCIILSALCVSCNQNKTTSGESSNEVLLDSTFTDTTIATYASDKETETDEIALIRKKVERINTTDLKKNHFEFLCDEKMMVDYFYDNNKIVKIAVDFGTVGDTYAKEGYYYDAGKLIFIYEFVEGGPACEGCITTNEYREYVNNDKTVKYLKNKIEEDCERCEFSASSKQYKLLEAKNGEQIKSILCR